MEGSKQGREDPLARGNFFSMLAWKFKISNDQYTSFYELLERVDRFWQLYGPRIRTLILALIDHNFLFQ